MYLKNQNLTTKVHRLVDRKKIAVHMNLDLDLWISKKNELLKFKGNKDEKVVLLLTGNILITYDDQKINCIRNNLFEQKVTCVLLKPNTNFIIQAFEKSEVLIIATFNQKLNQNYVYQKEKINSIFFGKNQWDNSALREVRTYFDYDNQPNSNLVIGEVINYPGCWSSYPPHHHLQPEIYFFKFDKPQAFGIGVSGDFAYIVKENDIIAIKPSELHPVVSAPGYPLYFCWIVRHLKNNPWTQRIVPKEHEWLLEKDVTYFKKGKIK